MKELTRDQKIDYIYSKLKDENSEQWKEFQWILVGSFASSLIAGISEFFKEKPEETVGVFLLILSVLFFIALFIFRRK